MDQQLHILGQLHHQHPGMVKRSQQPKMGHQQRLVMVQYEVKRTVYQRDVTL